MPNYTLKCSGCRRLFQLDFRVLSATFSVCRFQSPRVITAVSTYHISRIRRCGPCVYAVGTPGAAGQPSKSGFRSLGLAQNEQRPVRSGECMGRGCTTAPQFCDHVQTDKLFQKQKSCDNSGSLRKEANCEYIMFCVQFLLLAQSNPIISSLVPMGASPKVMRIHPKPRAETCKLLLPSLRFCIFFYSFLLNDQVLFLSFIIGEGAVGGLENNPR